MPDFAPVKKQLPPDNPWFTGWTVRVDSGFQGFANTYANGKLLLPARKPRGGQLTKNNKLRNTQQARPRVVGAHSIGGVKRCRILSDRRRMHNLNQFDIALELCAGLWNFCLTH